MSYYYLTTPIYYVNDKPHLGHAYTTVLGDVLARYHREMGVDTFYLTGTDEHGQKVQSAAEKRGISPQQHCDETCQRFKDLWKEINSSHDGFIRTTDEKHKKLVQEKLQQLWDKGEIYEDTYEGYYDVSSETFITKTEYDKASPEEQAKLSKIQEKNYFFRMSKYQDWLIKTIEDNPRFIFPEARKNFVLGILREPLGDLCISRPKSRLSWGITLPFDADYVTYVWFDALLNYVSGVQDKGYWPATLHLIGKDILMTHAIYWPTMLKAMELPLPKTILAHGWWMMRDAKMSKSVGNVVNPLDLMRRYGVDSFRYFLMREMVLGQDSNFSTELFITRVNTDLANDLGNLLSRIAKFGNKRFGGELTAPHGANTMECEELKKLAKQTLMDAKGMVDDFRLSQLLEEVMALVRATNRFFDAMAPWKKAKTDPEGSSRDLAVAAEALRIALSLIQPVMPEKVPEGLARLGRGKATPKDLVWTEGPLHFILSDGPSLFPRIEESSEEIAEQGDTAQRDTSGKSKLPKIIRAKVVEAAPHPDAEKLLALKVDDGEKVRSVCAGLREHISTEEITGRHVALVANLKPAKLRGIKSEGMLLAAEAPDGGLTPVDPGEGALGEVFAPSHPWNAGKKISIGDFDEHKFSVMEKRVLMNGELLKTPKGNTIASNAENGAKVS